MTPIAPAPENVRAILAIEALEVDAEETGAGPLRGIDLALGPGEAALLWINEFARSALADAALGLVAPTAGRVLFQGEDWTRLGGAEAARRRTAIGRVFTRTAWISNLDLDENILLAARHHTHRPDAELRAEANELARAFGLPGIPAARPAWLDRRTSQRAQWVRALLGQRTLLVLERPTEGVTAEDAAAWRRAMTGFRARGGAVLWLTADREVWENTEVAPTRRGHLSDGTIAWERNRDAPAAANSAREQQA